MPGVMVALLGEQPIPNLLGIRYEMPESVLLVETDRTANVSRRLCGLLDSTVETVRTSPYDIEKVRNAIDGRIKENGWQDRLIYNLTGGTKPMAMAAYGLAQSQHRPFIYVQSEGGKNLIYRYEFINQQAKLAAREEAPPLLTIDDYLRAHVDAYSTGEPQQWFERLIFEELRDSGQFDELMTSVKVGKALEIDLVLRSGNYVAFAELKSGANETHKAGVDQLSTAADKTGFGTYTRRLLITDRQINQNVRGLANSRGTRVITLISAQPNRKLSEQDRKELIRSTSDFLGRFGDRR